MQKINPGKVKEFRRDKDKQRKEFLQLLVPLGILSAAGYAGYKMVPKLMKYADDVSPSIAKRKKQWKKAIDKASDDVEFQISEHIRKGIK